MAKPPYDGITALRTLRDRLDEAASLEVIHPGGHVWKAYFNTDSGDSNYTALRSCSQPM